MPIITLPNFLKIDGKSARGKRRLRLSEPDRGGRVSTAPGYFFKEREVLLCGTNVMGLPFLWFVSLGKQRNEQ